MDADKKKKIIIGCSIGAAVLAVLAIILVIVLGKKEEAYRIIKVYEIDGNAVITRDGSEINAYKTMVLESGDLIRTGESDTITLRLDDDKYVYVQANTEFELIASGMPQDSKTTINLHEGSILNDIQNKLSADSSYEINTPNATMAVRGTTYYVSTYVGEDGKRYTRISVFDGTVTSDLVYVDGSVSGINTLVDRGNEVLIYTDDAITDYVGGGVRPIDYDSIPEDVLRSVISVEENGKNLDLPEGLSISENSVSENGTEGPFTVTFTYNGTPFAEQIVDKDECVKEPSLMPAASGSWDFDFSTPVTEDITIKWVE